MSQSTGDVSAAAADDSLPPRDRRGWARWYGWIVGAAALVTGLGMWVIGTPADETLDPYSFGEMGRSIASGNGFEGFGSLIQRRAPLYPMTLGGIYWVFGDRDRVALLFHVVLFVGTALLVYDLGRRYFNARSGLLAGLGCAFHPLLLRYVPTLHLETQLTFLTTLMVWSTMRFYTTRTWVNGVLIGLTAALGALTKAVVVLYPLVFGVGILLAVRRARRRGRPDRAPWVPLVAMVLAMIVVIAPWTARNYRASDHFVPISTGTGDAFLRGLIFSRWEFITLQEPPYTNAENESNEYFRRLLREEGLTWEEDDYTDDRVLTEEAKRVLREEPEEVLRKTAAGVFAFWYQLTSFKNSVLVLFCAVVAWALAIVGWRRARREHVVVWPFVLPAFYLNAVLAVLLALGRYSAPVIPALLVVSGFGADALLSRVLRQRPDAPPTTGPRGATDDEHVPQDAPAPS